MEIAIAGLAVAIVTGVALFYRWHTRQRLALTESLMRATSRERDALDQTLQEAQALINAILQGAPGSFVITDTQRQIRYISPQAATLFQTSQDAAASKTLMEVVRDHRIMDLVHHCLTTSNPVEEALEYAPGNRQLHLRALPTRDHLGILNGALLALQDVTELRHLERVRQEFIINVSHELRTPLASIKALVETLQEGAIADPSTALDFLQRVGVEVNHLTQLVSELRMLSDVESGQLKREHRVVAVEKLASDAVSRLSARADRKGLQMHVAIPPEMPSVLVDPVGIQQVLMNLLDNAIKFTPTGGHITISAAQRNGEVEIRIQDTGVGISQENLPRIFERLYKADKARASEGTGLGLAIVKHVVQSNKGRVWAESQLGRGSTFAFTLSTTPTSSSPS